MSYETLLYEKQDSIATVTINRPEKRNAWTTQVSEEIIDVFGTMEDDPEVLVTILTGTGGQGVFCRCGFRQRQDSQGHHRWRASGLCLAKRLPRIQCGR